MEQIIGTLLWLLSAGAFGLAALRLARCISEDKLERAVATGVIIAALVVGVAEILSLLKLLSSSGAWLAGSVLVSGLSRFLPYRNSLRPSELGAAWPLNRTIKGMLLAYGGLLLVALLLPPNTWDSMSYHLARVGYYLQQGDLQHFPTNNARQTEFPVNAELLMLWTIVFTKADFLSALVQYGSAWLAALATVGIALHLGLRRGPALLCGLIVLGFPQVALQATSTQNDLLAAALAAAAVLFLLGYIRSGGISAACVAGVAAGLSVGTKPTVWFFVPGFILLWLAPGGPRRTARSARLPGAAIFVCLALVFVTPQLWRNYAATQHLLPRQDIVHVAPLSGNHLSANVIRTASDLLDANDLPYPANRVIGRAKQAVFGLLSGDLNALNPPGATYPATRFEFKGNILSEDVAWYGLNGFCLAAAALFALPLFLLRREWTWIAYAALPFGAMGAHVLLLRWQPWGGRLYCAAMILLVPLGVRGALLLLRPLSCAWRRRAWRAMAILALTGAWMALLQNELKPLYPTSRLVSVWQLERDAQRCRHRPYNRVILDYLADRPRCRAGFCADADQWDYLVFLPGFRRFVVRYDGYIDFHAAFERDGCDVVLVQRNFYRGELPPDRNPIELNEWWTALERGPPK